MRSMGIPAGESAESEAAAFARQLHDSWGVGDAACNNGVLLLLSIGDRQVCPSVCHTALASPSRPTQTTPPPSCNVQSTQ